LSIAALSGVVPSAKSTVTVVVSVGSLTVPVRVTGLMARTLVGAGSAATVGGVLATTTVRWADAVWLATSWAVTVIL
jgi:hypothetical protein